MGSIIAHLGNCFGMLDPKLYQGFPAPSSSSVRHPTINISGDRAHLHNCDTLALHAKTQHHGVTRCCVPLGSNVCRSQRKRPQVFFEERDGGHGTPLTHEITVELSAGRHTRDCLGFRLILPGQGTADEMTERRAWFDVEVLSERVMWVVMTRENTKLPIQIRSHLLAEVLLARSKASVVFPHFKHSFRFVGSCCKYQMRCRPFWKRSWARVIPIAILER